MTTTTICDRAILIDRSGGQGHCWVPAIDLPADIAEEIAAEILDGGQDECRDYVASNGQHYRWTMIDPQAKQSPVQRDMMRFGHSNRD